MNGFQIRDENGTALSIKELDEQVAEFWDREVDPKYYARPYDRPSVGTNWYDTVGKAIAQKDQDNVWGMEPWDRVKDALFVKLTLGLSEHDLEGQIREIKEVNEFIEPYYELINHWQDKGYKPVTVTP